MLVPARVCASEALIEQMDASVFEQTTASPVSQMLEELDLAQSLLRLGSVVSKSTTYHP